MATIIYAGRDLSTVLSVVAASTANVCTTEGACARVECPVPTHVGDDEWAFVAPYMSLMTEEAPQRRHDLHEVFNALRWILPTGDLWRSLPGHLPP